VTLECKCLARDLVAAVAFVPSAFSMIDLDALPSQGVDVCFIHPEVKAAYQRGIYLFAKSLTAATSRAGFGTTMLTDFAHPVGQEMRAAWLYGQIDKPPQQKIRALQMVPRYLLHKLGQVQGGEVLAFDALATLTEKTEYLRDVQRVLNYEGFYDLCRLPASKPVFGPIDIDFLRVPGCRVAFTTEPVAIRSSRKEVKIIQTVHDLIVLNEHVHDINVSKFRRRLDAALLNADGVLAVSEYTRQEILERYPQLNDRVRVVYQPIPAHDETVLESESVSARAEVLQRFGLVSGNFVFFVGAIELRKNIARLIKAYQASEAAREMPLVLAGSIDKDYLAAEGVLGYFVEGAPVSVKGPGVVKYLGRVTELEKLCLLREARLFAFPTITEGFGIPLLEAQSMGCPVLTTNASAIPEVVGNSAVLIQDPTDVDELTQAINGLVSDPIRCGQLRADGLVNSQRFSKARFAASVGELIRSVG
jgi:glycosyltransferase involved in cell wall biosynthesis